MKLLKEENGVKWFVEIDGVNSIHTMEFAGQSLTGSWVGPQWVFEVLTSMPLEERAGNRTHDEWMATIHTYIRETGKID